MIPPSPELPLHIDSTMMSCFRSCSQKFRKEFVLGKRPPGLSIDLHAGGCFATALETAYEAVHLYNLPLPEALMKAHAAFALAWGNFELPEHSKTAKTYDNVWAAVEGYFTKWDPRLDHFQPYFAADGKPTFEYTFAIPLEPTLDPHDVQANEYGTDGHFPLHPSGGPFLYCGRFDQLGQIAGRPLWKDDKTQGRSFTSDWSELWDARSQFMGYTWALQQAGIPATGGIIRGVSILKTKLDYIETEKSYPQHLIASWHEQLRRDLWRIRRAWDEQYFDFNFGDTCTSFLRPCAFMTACTSPAEQEAGWLSNFEERHWNPLNKNPAKEEAA